jgi:hypothetical protein
MRQTADLLMVHPDPDVKEPHVDPQNAFCITAEVISIQNQLEVGLILSFFPALEVASWAFQPVIVTGFGHSGHCAHKPD